MNKDCNAEAQADLRPKTREIRLKTATEKAYTLAVYTVLKIVNDF
jgi:hypothetical protein